jgi:hypothetical protein
MTGTLRRPFECCSMSGIRSGCATTSWYWKVTPFAVNASRAAVV